MLESNEYIERSSRAGPTPPPEGAPRREQIAEPRQENEMLKRVIANKYPAPPNFYLRRLQTDLTEAEQRAERTEAVVEALSRFIRSSETLSAADSLRCCT